MVALLLTAAVAAAGTGLLAPILAGAAPRWGLVAQPNPRRVHSAPVPTGGGLALAAGFWIAAVWGLGSFAGWTGFLLGSLVIVATGLWDDWRGLAPWQKLAGQLAAAALLVAGGTRIEFVTHPLDGMVHIGWWGVPLTVLWIVALTNSLNFIDGLDGLAAGITAIACLPLAFLAAQRGQDGVVVLCAALLGASLGFLRSNFHPARIFLGDTGAMFAGFALGAISVEGAVKGAATVALSIPLLALGLPVFDTACAIIRRGRNGRPIYQADAGHVHHRLLQRGFSHRRAVLFLYGISALLGAAAVVLHQVSPWERSVFMVVIIAALALWASRLNIFDDRPEHGEGVAGRPRAPRAPWPGSGWTAGS